MIETRLTGLFALGMPVVSAPMALAAGGRLASAVAEAGALGLIGGGYADAAWCDAAFAEANRPVGVGFITWALADRPEVLEAALARDPRAVMLSFGDPAPFADRIRDAGVPLIVQVQTLRHARHAADHGAQIVIAQGAEAGGHGRARATMTLVPEVADMLARDHPEVLLLAAGGIADGRGLAAALLLGADGALVGSRLWASAEASVHPSMVEAALCADGDATIRSSVMDIARRLDWPAPYTARVLRNAFTDRWHDDLPGLLAVAETEAERWRAAWVAGDVATANTFVGEATGLIADAPPVAEILARMAEEAESLLAGGWRRA